MPSKTLPYSELIRALNLLPRMEQSQQGTLRHLRWAEVAVCSLEDS